MLLNKIIKYFFLPVYRPVSGMHDLIQDNRKIGYSILIFLFLGIIYTFSVQLAFMKGLGANVEPFIKIPAVEYYYWQRFYQIPFFFLTSIIFAGLVRLLSITFSGKGTFEDHFCLFCVVQTFPMLITMWLPETIYFVFFNQATIFPGWVDITRQIIGILWPLILMVIGIMIIEKIKWYAATLTTLISSIPIIALMVIFIR
jgi:hypothetical protein